MVDDVKYFCREIYPHKWKKKVKTYGVTPYHQVILELLTVGEGEAVLECGIGTGEPLALQLAQRQVSLYGLDIAEILLQECQKNFSNAGLNAACINGDGEDLPFQRDTFGLTYCFGTTWYLPDFSKAIGELIRVTRPGGLVLFDVLNIFHITPLMAWLVTAFLRRYLGKELGQWQLRTPWQVKRVLDKLDIDFEIRGLNILLPTAHPDLASHFPRFAYGLQTSRLRFLGSILIYVCQVP